MELIKINQTELKVMMSAEDMRHYELDRSLGDEDMTQREAIRTILREARRKTGFNSGGEKILVRMFPSRDGGCELFVTKLSTGVGTTERDKTATIVLPSLRGGIFIYSFASLSEMISACRRLDEAGYRDDSSAYRENSGRAYYLVLGVRSPLAEEMGGELMKMSTMYYINEYCSLICDGAVGGLSRFG